MELALSVGGDSNKKRERWGDSAAGRVITEGLALSCRDDHEVGVGARNGSPIQLDLKLSWSNVAGNDYETKDEVGASSSESLPMGAAGKYGREGGIERGTSRCSDEEEGVMGSTRKKLRLSKEQSCYLEESFKEHPTLNPKQKLALAKQLNLRPRQVEVWFQNRRARTKLKQTEVDCEYLKRCCESLTEENRRLRKEVQDLKALKTPNHPFRLHVPPTTLNICPSCDHTPATAPVSPPTPNHHRISTTTATTAYNHLLKSS